MTAPAESHTATPDLTRQIGLYAATCVTVGNIVGSGIFRSPASVARHLDSQHALLAAWALGGLLSLCGALSVTEAGTRHPRPGGVYVFLREAFGPACGFVFGWANFFVLRPTVIASIAAVFAAYAVRAVPPGAPGGTAETAVGMAAVIALTGINIVGVRAGTRAQSLLATAKVLGLTVLILCAFLLTPRAESPTPPSPVGGTPASPARALPVALAMAMIPILFAYDGWIDLTFLGGEVVEPRRNLPRAIIGGTVAVVGIYLLTNAAYARILTPAEMAAQDAVGAEVMRRLLGPSGETLLVALVCVSALGTLNGSVLIGARVTLAMARDGLFWTPAAAVHARLGTPHVALLLQGGLSCLWLWFANGFEDASGWFVTTSWVFYGLAVASLFVERRREQAAPRRDAVRGEDREGQPYRTPLYPFTPLLFLVVTLLIIGSDLLARGGRAAAGLLVASLGLPVYHLLNRAGPPRGEPHG